MADGKDERDIAERLTAWMRPTTQPQRLPGGINHRVVTDCADAADEIKRLRGALDQERHTTESLVALISDEASRAGLRCSSDPIPDAEGVADLIGKLGERAGQARPSPSRKWQPIATAPLDRDFLACDEDGSMYRCWYWSSYDDEDEDGAQRLVPIWGAHCGQPVSQSPEPTHWMPLPAAPGQDAGGSAR